MTDLDLDSIDPRKATPGQVADVIAALREARAEVERLMQEVERLHNAVRDIDAAYLVARAQDRADGGYRDGYCDGLEHAERIMRGN